MIYSGSSGDSLIEDITFRTNADLTEFTLADRTRYINEAYSIVAFTIMKADGRMTWDDPNHPDQPISTFDLVANQTDYNIFSSTPTAIQDWLAIQRVDIMNAGGVGTQLIPLDQNDYKGTAQSEMNKAAGIPYAFDMVGSVMRLYPASNYNYSGGVTIWFDRAPSYFTVSDTTKRPGFDTRFHQYLSIYAANQWNGTKKRDWSLEGKLKELEQQIGITYAVERDKAEQPIIKREYKKFK
jgi:hypothetical protein